METIIFATGNQNKLKEIREIVKDLPFEIKSLKELNIDIPIDENGVTIWKPGTAKELWRRKKDHDRDYVKSSCNHRMMDGTEFHYLWAIPLAKWTTRKIEEATIDRLKEENFGEYIRNDRFVDVNCAQSVDIIIRKTYTIPLCAF